MRKKDLFDVIKNGWVGHKADEKGDCDIEGKSKKGNEKKAVRERDVRA